ncbi:WD40 repeat domain-containing protein [Haliscomenobacter hydrossis]|uniref:WD40 repeat-containing protein n=1 Tax=Haliscomenobacter hydrossis (strain ATCC 27775 / DSM 1100 / LMG 10767 / O) TaxID=760192 RepID=F4KU96_HALH1|nr:WD40 repeat domain-containing protein [Haliscomenobacter hydrossis]AEE50193.1 WD40 repeat-containing protein [Haliscomenobacter hydrossis DSM 1100]
MKTILDIHRHAVLTGHNASVFALSATQDPRYILSGAGDGWVVRWDLDEPELGKLIAKVDTQIFSLQHLPDLDQVVVGNMNGGVHWVDLTQPERTKNIAHHRKGVYRILRVADQVFTAGGDGILTRWDVHEGRTLESIQLSHQSLRGLAYCPARQELAVGASDRNIYLLDVHSFQVKASIKAAHSHSVFSVQFSPDGKYLLSGGRDAMLKVWDADGLHNLSAQAAHWFTINDIVFQPGGALFATASRDKTIKIWDAQTFQLHKVLDTIRDRCHVNSVNSLLWTTHQNQLVSASDDRSLMVWRQG